MPTYTVICADKSTGATHPLLIAADNEEDAAARACASGLMVGKAMLAIDPRPVSSASADATAHAAADTARQVQLLRGESLVQSPIITIGFGIALGMAVFATLAVAVLIVVVIVLINVGAFAPAR